jgi:hypothetical protein
VEKACTDLIDELGEQRKLGETAMYRALSLFALGSVLACGAAPCVQAAEAVQATYIRQAGETTREVIQPRAEDFATGQDPDDEDEDGTDWRYRRQNGQWFYWTGKGGWMRWDGAKWLAAPRSQQAATQYLDQQEFNSWFGAYRNFQGGRPALQTAEEGSVQLGTADITGEAEAAELMEYGGIPAEQARRRRAVQDVISGGGAWFNSGSPTGIKYGYGSGYGYGGYGFDNPYGYGSRSGSGGAYGIGFGPFGSVGGQTGERLSSLITGKHESGLISSEPGAIGAPAQIERGPVGGTFGRAGAGARKLGGSAGGD